MDLPAAKGGLKELRDYVKMDVVEISALQGTGIDKLIERFVFYLKEE